MGLLGSLFPAHGAGAKGPDEIAPIVAYYDYKRLGTPAFSMLVPTDWVPLEEHDEANARLQYVANLREVLDAPPDVPPGSFDRLLSFAAYWIPEINGYLLATVVDVSTYPVRLFDVLHEHAKGSNDWGESLYIEVESVHRNERFTLDAVPARAVDVKMSGDMSIAAQYFQIPSSFNRIGGVVLILPSDSWDALHPLIEHLRASIQVGASDEEPSPDRSSYQVVEVDDGGAPGARVLGALTGEAGLRRPWHADQEQNREGFAGAAVIGGLVVLAVAYPLIFFLTLRLIYFGITTIGPAFFTTIDVDAYRRAADANPWTMGLLTSERMIMLCAMASMGLAAILLAFVMRS